MLKHKNKFVIICILVLFSFTLAVACTPTLPRADITDLEVVSIIQRGLGQECLSFTVTREEEHGEE